MRLAHPLRRLLRRNLDRVSAERARCLAALHAAQARQDTRAQHAAERPAITATCAQLAAEIGWKGAR